MVAVNQQAQQQSDRFDIWQALKDLEFVTTFFTWLFRLMARLAEPLMTLSTIYVIVEAGVPSVSVNWLHWLAVGIMISAPEVILPGGFILANELHTQGNKRSWVLYAMCWIFVVLTAGTLADLFIWHFQGAALSTLMWVRCAAAVGYSVLFRVITYKQEKEVLPITDVLERFQAFTDLVESLSQQVGILQENTPQPEPVDYAKLATYTQIPAQELTQISERIDAKLARTLEEIRPSFHSGSQEVFGTISPALLVASPYTFSEFLGEIAEKSVQESMQILPENLSIADALEVSQEATSSMPVVRKYYVTYEAASEMTNLTIRQLKLRVNSGEIHENAHGKLKVSDLERLKNRREK